MRSDDAAPNSPAIDLRAAADDLFASATLVDVLLLLCAHPAESFYVNELIKRTGRFPRSVQLALGKLEEARLVQTERRANAKYYRIAVEHPFFPELRSLALKILDVNHALRAALEAVGGLRVAFLRSGEPDTPDLDLVVIADAERAAVEEAVAAAERRVGRSIHLDCFTGEEWVRQVRRERSFARWLLQEERAYVVGDDSLLT
ncbi:MAG TPA: winged helix-turn-helix domain-containing protein [Chloroflexota bacterium]|nr:winged helix-turn-helix domain-containing protein [Chloroflexota bacterium]